MKKAVAHDLCATAPFVLQQAVWIAWNTLVDTEFSNEDLFQYRKRYGLHAMTSVSDEDRPVLPFQYRKRYGLHAMQKSPHNSGLFMFQYRKRYGLHAIRMVIMNNPSFDVSIPQAVWIACN